MALATIAVAAFIGAIFAIGLQVAAIQSFGTPDRMAFLQSDLVLAVAPDPDSPLWGIPSRSPPCSVLPC